jgi:hypothetical protein
MKAVWAGRRRFGVEAWRWLWRRRPALQDLSDSIQLPHRMYSLVLVSVLASLEARIFCWACLIARREDTTWCIKLIRRDYSCNKRSNKYYTTLLRVGKGHDYTHSPYLSGPVQCTVSTLPSKWRIWQWIHLLRTTDRASESTLGSGSVDDRNRSVHVAYIAILMRLLIAEGCAGRNWQVHFKELWSLNILRKQEWFCVASV